MCPPSGHCILVTCPCIHCTPSLTLPITAKLGSQKSKISSAYFKKRPIHLRLSSEAPSSPSKALFLATRRVWRTKSNELHPESTPGHTSCLWTHQWQVMTPSSLWASRSTRALRAPELSTAALQTKAYHTQCTHFCPGPLGVPRSLQPRVKFPLGCLIKSQTLRIENGTTVLSYSLLRLKLLALQLPPDPSLRSLKARNLAVILDVFTSLSLTQQKIFLGLPSK